MLNEIITTIFGASTATITNIGSLLNAGVAVFWNSETSKLTDVGTVGLIVTGIGVAFMGFRMLRRLFRPKV